MTQDLIAQLVWSKLSPLEQEQGLQRPFQETVKEHSERVSELVAAVKQGGDQALCALTRTFDGVETAGRLKVERSVIDSAYKRISPKRLAALVCARDNLMKFHRAGLPQDFSVVMNEGLECATRHRAIQSVGLYIPGGTAPLPSTVLMLGVPSLLAGCPTRILISPPDQSGGLDDSILVAAHLCEITELFLGGGAQAVAALAYGTESIPKVDKIFGPGNRWVTEAKMQVSRDPRGAAIDMPAGPSEIMILADATANPQILAADLLSQAEHGSDSQAILVTTHSLHLQSVPDQLRKQVERLSRRSIAKESLSRSAIILVDDLATALLIANAYAPEHLMLQVDDAQKVVDRVHCAGSVFVGSWIPESFGDYASGTNHVLPTSGWARSYSGLGTADFMRRMTVQTATPAGFLDLANTVEVLASMEGLDGHAQAVSIRRNSGVKR